MKRKGLSARATGYIVVITSIILVLSFFFFGYTNLIEGEITDVKIVGYVRDINDQTRVGTEIELSQSQKEAIAGKLSRLKGYKTTEKSLMVAEAIYSFDVSFDIQTKNGLVGAVITFSNKFTTFSIQTSDPSIVENGAFKLKRFITQKQHNKIFNDIFQGVIELK